MAKKNNPLKNDGTKPLKHQIAGTEQSQKRLKNKLKQLSLSEERYRRLFETAQDGILLLDAATGKITDVNPYLVDMLGYKKNEFLSKHLWEIGAFTDIAASRNNFIELQENKYVRYENLPLESKTGQHIDVEFVSNVYLVGKKKVIQCNVRNITERATVGRALKEATDFYESIIRHSPYAIVIHRDGILQFINPKGLVLLGANPDDKVIGQPISRFIHPDYLPVVSERLKSLEVRGTFIKPAEEVFLRLDGSPVDVEAVTTLVQYHGRNAFMSIIIDIHDRKKFEQDLKESEEKFRNISENSPNMIFINIGEKIAYINNKCVTCLGHSKEELLSGGISYIDLISDEDKERVRAIYKSHIQKIETPSYECRMKRKDGSFFDVINTSKSIFYEGEAAVLSIVADISVQKKMERELLANLKLTQQYLDLVGSIVVAIDKEQNITLLNKKGCEVLGIKCAEAAGKNWFDHFVPEGERAAVKRTFQSIISGNVAPVERYENDVITSSGEKRTISWHNSLLYDECGRIAGALSSGDDITDRRRMEKELLDAKEEKFRIIFDSAKDGILLVDINTKERKLHMANAAFCLMLGYDAREISGLCVRDIHPEKDLPYVMDRFEKQARQEISVAEDIPVKRKGGTVFYADINSIPVIIEGKRYLLGFFRDISQRKESESAIKNLNRQIELILGATKTGLDIIDEDFNLVYIDPEWKKIYGDNKGKKCYEYFMGKDSVCQNCGAKKALDTKEPFVSEELLAKEGNRPVQVTTIPFQDNDGHWLVAEVNVDISERKQWEEDKRRASEMKASTEIRSRFTSMVSHELRSPLSAIKEGVNIVLDGLVGSVNDQQRHLLNLSKRNIDRLARLINNVLDFQKIEAGKMEYVPRPANIKDLIQEVISTMEVLAKEKNIFLVPEIAGTVPELEFDKDKITQVLINLVGNAIKVTQTGGVTIDASPEKDAVHVTVRDTGPGINKSDIEKLFRPFEQLTFSSRRQKGGTGLGLAISKEIILAHDGKIWAESEEGKGSAFHFTLPIGKAGGHHD